MTNRKSKFLGMASSALCLFILAGCVVGPKYHPPTPPSTTAANYKESPVNFQDTQE